MKFNKETEVLKNTARAKRLRASGEAKGTKNNNIVKKCERNIRNINKSN